MDNSDFFPFITNQEFNSLDTKVNILAVRLGQEIAQISNTVSIIEKKLDDMGFAEGEGF